MLIKYIGVQYYLLYKDDASTIEEKLFDHDVSTHMPHKFYGAFPQIKNGTYNSRKKYGRIPQYTASRNFQVFVQSIIARFIKALPMRRTRSYNKPNLI